jgi:hypothetical protein
VAPWNYESEVRDKVFKAVRQVTVAWQGATRCGFFRFSWRKNQEKIDRFGLRRLLACLTAQESTVGIRKKSRRSGMLVNA